MPDSMDAVKEGYAHANTHVYPHDQNISRMKGHQQRKGCYFSFSLGGGARVSVPGALGEPPRPHFLKEIF